MEKFKLVVFFVFYLSASRVLGQDPHFSNFNTTKLYYNPAYAGIDYGIRVNMAYRRQWPKIPSKFQTLYTGFDEGARFAKIYFSANVIILSGLHNF